MEQQRNDQKNAKRLENDGNIKQATMMSNLQFEASEKDRQVQDYMRSVNLSELEHAKRKKMQEKAAFQAAENKRIAEAEQKFVKTDRARRDYQNRFIQELDDATQYQQYLKQAEEEKKKADHAGYLRYCQEAQQRKAKEEEDYFNRYQNFDKVQEQRVRDAEKFAAETEAKK